VEATVPIESLPNNPNLGHLKSDAKILRDRVRAGEADAVELVRDLHPRFPHLVVGSPAAVDFKLADAQLTVARRYGHPSWPALRRYVEQVNRLSRSPHKETAQSTADELLTLACLNYGSDHPTRWREAARLLAEHPDLARHSIHTAAAVGDVAAGGAILAADPDAASAEGGPFRWPPLLYAAYSRLPGDHIGMVRLLLEHGADPNAGFLWEGLPSPFTALTGVFGGGEQGAPPHQDELALARLLLEAGAEANDSQTIYNRGAGNAAVRDDTAFLELLLDFGLGRGDGGPWRRALGHQHQSPAEVAAEALQYAAEAGLEQRARLLLDRGVDPNRPGTHPLSRGRTPYEAAVLHGNVTVADLLEAAGARTDTVSPSDQFVGACLAGDRVAMERTLTADRSLLPRALRHHRDLVARAAALGRAEAVLLLVDLGFEVNTRHRTTALHQAALRGDLPLVKLLVELGADPAVLDTEHRSTPAGWARHFGHDVVADYLDGLQAGSSG
jgi:ankyrin repeat protein